MLNLYTLEYNSKLQLNLFPKNNKKCLDNLLNFLSNIVIINKINKSAIEKVN